MAADRKRLTGKQKAAILMLLLGPEISADVFKHLSEEEIEQLTVEIANLRGVDRDSKDHVLEESHDLLTAEPHPFRGGADFARELLQEALGSRKAREIMDRLTASLQKRPFGAARKADPSHLFYFIKDEHPQTIALILAHLHVEQAAYILSSLPQERQVDVAIRLANLNQTSSDVLFEVESTLEKQLSASGTQEFVVAGGIDVVVNVLNRVDRATQSTIMAALDSEDPELATEIRNATIPFDALAHLDDHDIRRIVEAVDKEVWSVALKTAGESVTDRILRNMPRRAADELRDAVEGLGPVRLRDVEEAQQNVMSVVRSMQRAGEILYVRCAEDEIIV